MGKLKNITEFDEKESFSIYNVLKNHHNLFVSLPALINPVNSLIAGAFYIGSSIKELVDNKFKLSGKILNFAGRGLALSTLSIAGFANPLLFASLTAVRGVCAGACALLGTSKITYDIVQNKIDDKSLELVNKSKLPNKYVKATATDKTFDFDKNEETISVSKSRNKVLTRDEMLKEVGIDDPNLPGYHVTENIPGITLIEVTNKKILAQDGFDKKYGGFDKVTHMFIKNKYLTKNEIKRLFDDLDVLKKGGFIVHHNGKTVEMLKSYEYMNWQLNEVKEECLSDYIKKVAGIAEDSARDSAKDRSTSATLLSGPSVIDRDTDVSL